MHFGVRRRDFLRAVKKASWSWLSGCKPWSQGKTWSAAGKGWVARWSMAWESFSAEMEYMGGSLAIFSKPLGG